MKYKSLVKFITNYHTCKDFEEALNLAIGAQINKERLDIYEKLSIYFPELTEKNKSYLQDRIDKNKKMLQDREKDLIKTYKVLEKEKETPIKPELDNYLYGVEPTANHYGTIRPDNPLRPRTGTEALATMQRHVNEHVNQVAQMRDEAARTYREAMLYGTATTTMTLPETAPIPAPRAIANEVEPLDAELRARIDGEFTGGIGPAYETFNRQPTATGYPFNFTAEQWGRHREQEDFVIRDMIPDMLNRDRQWYQFTNGIRIQFDNRGNILEREMTRPW